MMKYNDYLKLLGLCELVKDCRRRHLDLENCIGDLVNELPDEHGYHRHVSDAMFEEDPAAYIISHLKIDMVEVSAPDNQETKGE